MNRKEDPISKLTEPGFLKGLSEEERRIILEAVTKEKEKEGGLMGRVFGTKKENASMYVALIVCIMLAGIGLAVWKTSNDIQIWNVIIPVITSALGFIFGKGAAGGD